MNKIEAYATSAQQGIAAAFVQNGIGAHWLKAVQGPQTISYALKLHNPTTKNIGAALNLSRSIESCTGISSVRITIESGVLWVEIPSIEASTVHTQLLQGDGLRVPVGLSSRRAVLGIDFDHDSHLIAAGLTNAGKSCAVRNILYHLLKQNDDLQLVVSCRKLKDWRCLKSVATIITDNAETLAMLNALIDVMNERCKKEIEQPTIFVVLDDLLNLLETPGVEEALNKLLPLSRGVGIHFILITQRVSGIDKKIIGNCSARLLFSVADTVDSAIIGGRAQLHAETLGRFKGDALLISSERVSRIACGYISTDDVEQFSQNFSRLAEPRISQFHVKGLEALSGGQNVQNGDSVNFTESCEIYEKASREKAREKLSQFKGRKLSGRPKSAEDIAFVRAAYEFLGGNERETMKHCWGNVGGPYLNYIREVCSN